MSLINKMLQDLDRRGSRPGAAIEANVLPVPQQRAPLSLALALGAVLVLLLVGAGVFASRHFRRAPALAPGAVVAAPVPVPVLMPVLRAPAVLAPVPMVAAVVPDSAAMTAAALARKAPAVASKDDASAVPIEPIMPAAPQRKGRGAETAPRAARSAAPPVPVPVVSEAGPGRQMGVPQRAENAYRRALAALQEGRVGEAIGALEQTLTLDPGHEAARQTLVGLLIENKHPDEAMRQLQQGLALEPRQPALAMLLARMQIERGASGIDTLLRSLPYVDGNADYHAFLAGALQRQQRHREAIEQYQAALRAMPQNGIWLMGLGISLQAEKRNLEALEAFKQARAAANLSPELQVFVAGKVQQLSR